MKRAPERGTHNPNRLHAPRATGTNMVQTSASSAEACCSYCSDAPGCVGFTWVSGNQDCYLKSSVDPATPDSAVTSGTVTGPPPPPGPCAVFPGQNNHGHNMQEAAGAATADACCSACVALSGCIGWTFVSEGGAQCYLKDKLDPLTPDPAVISGAVGAPGPSCQLSPGVNSMGTIAAPPVAAASAGACCGACANATFKCVAFTFVESTGKCFLKNTTGAPVADPGATSGTPPSPCSATQGVNVDGAIIAPPTQAADPGACCAACMAGAGCASWTFISATQKCFLRNTTGAPFPDAGAVTGAPPSPCALQPGVNSMGTITRALPAESPAACCAACLSANATSCVGFSFTSATSTCFLKSSLGTPVADANVISGTLPQPHHQRCSE